MPLSWFVLILIVCVCAEITCYMWWYFSSKRQKMLLVNMTYGFCCVAGCQKSLQWLHSVTGKTSSPQLVFIFPVFITHWGCRFSQGKAFCWAYSAYQLISNVVCSQFCHLCLTVSFWSPLWVTVVTDVVEQFRLTCNISWYFVARLLMKLVSN